MYLCANINPQKTTTMEQLNFQEFAGNARKILAGIKNYAVRGGKATTKMMLELYDVMIAKNTPTTDKMIIGAALAYQVLPFDLLPKSKFGLLGFLDNAAALYYAYKKVQKSITPAIEAKVEATMQKWFGGEKGDFVDAEMAE